MVESDDRQGTGTPPRQWWKGRLSAPLGHERRVASLAATLHSASSQPFPLLSCALVLGVHSILLLQRKFSGVQRGCCPQPWFSSCFCLPGLQAGIGPSCCGNVQKCTVRHSIVRFWSCIVSIICGCPRSATRLFQMIC